MASVRAGSGGRDAGASGGMSSGVTGWLGEALGGFGEDACLGITCAHVGGLVGVPEDGIEKLAAELPSAEGVGAARVAGGSAARASDA